MGKGKHLTILGNEVHLIRPDVVEFCNIVMKNKCAFVRVTFCMKILQAHHEMFTFSTEIHSDSNVCLFLLWDNKRRIFPRAVPSYLCHAFHSVDSPPPPASLSTFIHP